MAACRNAIRRPWEWRRTCSSDKSLTGRAEKTATDASTGVDSDTSANVRNWMECVRSRKTPNADIEAGYRHSVALCMTIAALHTGQRVTFDDRRQEVRGGQWANVNCPYNPNCKSQTSKKARVDCLLEFGV